MERENEERRGQRERRKTWDGGNEGGNDTERTKKEGQWKRERGRQRKQERRYMGVTSADIIPVYPAAWCAFLVFVTAAGWG